MKVNQWVRTRRIMTLKFNGMPYLTELLGAGETGAI